MDEVNAMLDGIHEPMDEANAIKRSADMPERRAFSIGSRMFETMDDSIMVIRASHDYHGFIHSPSGRICFIHGFKILSTSRPFLIVVTGSRAAIDTRCFRG